MLHEFLSRNRGALIERCRSKVADRESPLPSLHELDHGIPLFIDQLIKTLRVEQSAAPSESWRVSGPAGGGESASSELGEVAMIHGGELMHCGYTVEQVVHDYGDLCQAITDLAFEVGEPVEVNEFRTLNRCLDNAIASAVAAFNYHRDSMMSDRQTRALNVQIGCFGHELRNFLNTATLALFAMRDGNLGLTGATGTVLDRALVNMRSLVDRSLADVRMNAGMAQRNLLFSLSDFIAEVKLSGTLEANVRKIELVVSDVDEGLAVDGDRDLLLSAVGNLLQNAFKFTHPNTSVLLNAYGSGDHIRIDVEDHGDGMQPEEVEKMFEPFTQGGIDKSGMGLGLSITRRSVEANHGVLRVINKKPSGCIFTIELPRQQMPPARAA